MPNRALYTATNKVLNLFDMEIAPRIRRGRSQTQQHCNAIFFHVPKCGGTSVVQGLSRLFGTLNAGGKRRLFKTDARAIRQACRDLSVSRPAFVDALLRYQLASRDNYFIAGHIPFSRAAVAGFEQEWHFLTMLRDPKERLLSAYYFDRYKDKSGPYVDFISDDLETWLGTQQGRNAGNTILRYFVGDRAIAESVRDGKLNAREMQESIDTAISNLSNFSIIGDLSDTEKFLSDIENVFGCSTSFEETNVTPKSKRKKFHEHAPSVQARVAELCKPDQAIYDYFFRSAAPARWAASA